MTAAYAYHLDAASPAVQSGRPHSILLNLRKLGLNVQELFPLAADGLWQRRLIKVGTLLRHHQYLIDRDAGLLRGFGQQLNAWLKRTNADFIFSPSTLPLSYLETDLPVTFCSDAPFCAMLDYYDSFTRLTSRQLDLSEALEGSVLRRATLAVYPTRWAADQAARHYGIPRERIAVIPFGANFGRDNQRAEVERWIEERSANTELRLLYVGREWERKGGSLVVKTADWLRAQGIHLHVDFVGCRRPASCWGRPSFTFHGNLSANKPEEAGLLSDLYRKAHFVFVPSRAEAYGMTLCEANAFGLPAITTATGGIAEIIRPGINGQALPLDAGPAQYGEAILASFHPKSHYRQLALSTFAEFEQRLNWEAFTREFLRHLNTMNPQEQPTPTEPTPISVNGGGQPAARPEAAPTGPARRLRVAFLENEFLSSENVRSWSGLPFHMRHAMEAVGFEIVPVKVKDPATLGRWARFAYWRLIRNRRYLRNSEESLLHSYGRQATEQLARLSLDAVFTPSSWLAAHLQTSLPVVLWSDATFANVLNFYHAFSNLAPGSIRDGHTAERAALERCRLAFFSSEWAARSAVADYGISPDRVEVLAFGANIKTVFTAAEVEEVISARPADQCRLLFVGVEWDRKGAPLTIEIVRLLQARGLKVELKIVGCLAPRNAEIPAGVEVTGFISKATEEGRQKIDELFRTSHLFIMPTRADCTPCVYSEANTYALPCIGTDVGGVASVILPDVNGRTFPLEAGAEEYAEYIAGLMGDRSRYEQLCRSSWGESQSRLSWQRSAERIMTRLSAICPPREGARG